ncbi:hypothetical protein WwAna0043, partial [Wolbachia endosymbiont of Drosophila ananassae]
KELNQAREDAEQIMVNDASRKSAERSAKRIRSGI